MGELNGDIECAFPSNFGIMSSFIFFYNTLSGFFQLLLKIRKKAYITHKSPGKH